MSVKFSDCCELAVGHKSEELAAQDLRKDTRYRVGSNKLHTNTRMFEFLNQGIREPLVLQLVNGLSRECS